VCDAACTETVNRLFESGDCQVFVGSALSSEDDGVAAIKAWAVSKLPEGPTLYPKVRFCSISCIFFCISEVCSTAGHISISPHWLNALCAVICKHDCSSQGSDVMLIVSASVSYLHTCTTNSLLLICMMLKLRPF
jgi:hypothetical protein